MANEWDLLRWALTVPITSTEHIGVDKIRLVLIALGAHANAVDGRAWPSVATLVKEMHGFSPRTVRNARDALLDQRVITCEPRRQGRVTRYILPIFAVQPANLSPNDIAGQPANHFAGDFAGDFAGQPATNRTEITNSSGRSSEMGARTEPRDEALAVFSRSHPGREQEALRAALEWYRRAHGDQPCTNPAAYFGRWPDDDLRSKIRLGRPTKEPCARCHGEGLVYEYDNDGGVLTFAKCTHELAAAVA